MFVDDQRPLFGDGLAGGTEVEVLQVFLSPHGHEHLVACDHLPVLERILQIDSKVIGIVMTGYSSIGYAVKAMKAGAFDFLINRSTTKSSLVRSTRPWRRIAVARTCSRRGKPSVRNIGWSSSLARVKRSGACLSLSRRLRTPSPSEAY